MFPKRSLLFASVVIAISSHNAICAPSRSDRSGNPMQLVFEDDFSSAELDLSTWRHDITLSGEMGRNEFEAYVNNRTNSFVREGALHIQPTLTSDLLGADCVSGGQSCTIELWALNPADTCTCPLSYGCSRSSNAGARIALNPVQSARISTYGGFSFAYGRLEVEAKLPRGDWMWPAVWLLPERSEYGPWPASGEIDLLESRGNAPGYAGAGAGTATGCDAVGSTLHWGPHASVNRYERTTASEREDSGRGESFTEKFTTFGLFWDESGLYTYVGDDSRRVLEVPFADQSFWERGGFERDGRNNPWAGRGNGAPFDRPMYIILNVAVGGVNGYFPDVAGKPWRDSDQDGPMRFWEARDQWLPTWQPDGSSALQIRSVRVWQAKNGGGAASRSYSPQVARRMAAAGIDVGDWGGSSGGSGAGGPVPAPTPALPVPGPPPLEGGGEGSGGEVSPAVLMLAELETKVNERIRLFDFLGDMFREMESDG
ncbi:unnamed protein product [Phaeothamnion confervicola]